MTKEHFEIIFFTKIGFYVVATVMSLIQFQKRERYVKLMALYCGACAFADTSAYLLYSKLSTNQIMAFFNILTFPVLSYLYFLITGRKHKKVFGVLSVMYISFGIMNVFFIQKKDLNSYTLFSAAIILIVYCLYYFYWLLKELPTTKLDRLPMFWINSGFMIYFSSTLFLFVFTPYLVQVLKNNLLVYWSFHNFAGIIEFSFIIFALWTDLRNIKMHST